ncbi:MAG TPA: multicopper oxidase domain-containing protein, partial [Pirellulaceae bacterium]|nr:multicopper oxidase domain-containing protein [Pirellulaceae bacterium]
MSRPEDRRHFLKTTSIVAAGGLASGIISSSAKAQPPLHTPSEHQGHAGPTPEVPEGSDVQAEYEGFSRFKPSRGNDPDSDFYLGKRVPGFRSADAAPVPFEAPDLAKLPWKMVRGAKEFHLVPMAVEREFLPGYKMNVYGYNDTMPGPTIEVNQGDRVRIVVTNELPEDTYVHWH